MVEHEASPDVRLMAVDGLARAQSHEVWDTRRRAVLLLLPRFLFLFLLCFSSLVLLSSPPPIPIFFLPKQVAKVWQAPQLPTCASLLLGCPHAGLRASCARFLGLAGRALHDAWATGESVLLLLCAVKRKGAHIAHVAPSSHLFQTIATST